MGSDVAIAGAGVIGLGIAWRCAQRGLSVTVVDPAPGSGATWTAAGILGPVTELHYGEEELLRLNIESARRYPDFVADLEADTGLAVGYRPTGTVVAAWDGADIAALRDLHAFQQSLGLSSELVSGRELRKLEPALASGLPGGLIANADHQVDNRLLHQALLAAAARHGIQVIRAPIARFVVVDGRVTAAILGDGGRLNSDCFVLACGAWAGGIAGLPHDARPPVRPVKGQTVHVRLPEPAISHVVRGSVKGASIYLVPRADGRIVVGASVEEAGFDVRPRAGAVYELLRDAQSLLPLLGEAEFLEVSTSVRPGSPDNAPMIGPSALDGLIIATGHYRNGILLTPITADCVSELVATQAIPDLIKPFDARRFAKEAR